MTHEREIAEEQAFHDRAHDALLAMLRVAQEMREGSAVAHITTEGSMAERDLVMDRALKRMQQLDVGDAALFFGRLDYPATDDGVANVFRIGRLAVTDDHVEPLIVDWRAPIAEAFYRATAIEPFGLARRRHVSIRDLTVVSVEDEYFADDDGELMVSDEQARSLSDEGLVEGGLAFGGPAALLAALGRARTGRMGDIVSTIQREQDEIIRAPLQGILLVQGGPGTGKTAVALHRAAYLLYTHRFTLEQQGVLVVGPNPLFLNYIGNVLPSLGESGVTLSTVAGLVTGVQVRATESDEVAQLKGDIRMVRVIRRAVLTRERPLREEVTIPFGRGSLRVTPNDTKVVVERARSRNGNHNSRRSAVGRELAHRLADRYCSEYRIDRDVLGRNVLQELEEQIRADRQFKQVLQRIWPRITGPELIHDLFGSRALLRVACRDVLTEDEANLLFRPWSPEGTAIPWTEADLALIDEARILLGPRKRPRSGAQAPISDDAMELLENRSDEDRAAARRELQAARAGYIEREYDEAEIRTFGHIVVDEAQNLSQMELRALKRRDEGGSMTVVGDMAQATNAAASASWQNVLDVLEPSKKPLRVDLTVSYRTPEEVLRFAEPTLRAAIPDLASPTPVRRAGAEPRVVLGAHSFADTLASVVREERAALGSGRLAVVVITTRVREIRDVLTDAGVAAVAPDLDPAHDLSSDVVVIGAESANGLEFDAVVVVEPGEIAARGSRNGDVTARGLRTLYISLTRPTRRLAVVHERPLPPTLRQ